MFPPGPRGVVEVTRAFGAFTEEPATAILAMTQEHGGTCGFRVGRERIVLLGDPELVGEVLLDKQGVFVKDRVTRSLGTFLGRGLLTSEGDLWRRQRKLIAPSLTKKHIASYAETMVRIAEGYARGLATGQVREAAADMSQVTLDIVVETLFGTGLSAGHDRVGHAIDSLMDDFHEVIHSWRRLLPDWVPFAARRRTARTVLELDAILLELVTRRRASGELGGDLLSRLLEARDEADPTQGMSDGQLRDELITLFVAGHETTANALSWTLLLLADHPEVDARVADELRAVLGDRPATVDDMAALPFTRAVVDESMRLYPPAPIIGREATRDVVIGPFTFPRGTAVLISPWALHHDPGLWRDVEAFRPDRWLDGSTADLPRHAYLPFGGGPRVCVGNHFAIMETVLVLASIVRAVRFERTAQAPVIPQASITLRPRDGLPLRVRRREGADGARPVPRAEAAPA